MSDDDHARLVALLERVALPLARGGTLTPVRPIGATLASRLADALGALSPAHLSVLRRARGDLLRRIFATDEDPPPGRGSVLLLAALNDLLQCLNPALGARRASKLVEAVDAQLVALEPPSTLAEALCRHATLAGLGRLVRRDTAIEWWSGHARLVGRSVPARLRAWPKLRRVREVQRLTPLCSLAEGAPLCGDRYAASLRALVASSPLTELTLADVVGADPARLTALSSTSLGAAIVARVLDGASDAARRAWEAARAGSAHPP